MEISSKDSLVSIVLKMIRYQKKWLWSSLKVCDTQWFNMTKKQQSQAVAFQKLIDAARERRSKGRSAAFAEQTFATTNHTAAASTAVASHMKDMLTLMALSSTIAPARGDPVLPEQTMYPSCPIADALLADPDSAPHVPVIPPYLSPQPHRDK